MVRPPPPQRSGTWQEFGTPWTIGCTSMGATTTATLLLLEEEEYILLTMASQTPARSRNAVAGGDAPSSRLKGVVILRTEHVVVVRRFPLLSLTAAVASTAMEDAARGLWGGCVHSYCAGRQRVSLKRMGHGKYRGVPHAVSQAICVGNNTNPGGILNKRWIWEMWWSERIGESTRKR